MITDLFKICACCCNALHKKATLTVGRCGANYAKNCQLYELVAGLAEKLRLCTQHIFVTLTVEEGQRLEVGVVHYQHRRAVLLAEVHSEISSPSRSHLKLLSI